MGLATREPGSNVWPPNKNSRLPRTHDGVPRPSSFALRALHWPLIPERQTYPTASRGTDGGGQRQPRVLAGSSVADSSYGRRRAAELVRARVARLGIGEAGDRSRRPWRAPPTRTQPPVEQR